MFALCLDSASDFSSGQRDLHDLVFVSAAVGHLKDDHVRELAAADQGLDLHVSVLGAFRGAGEGAALSA